VRGLVHSESNPRVEREPTRNERRFEKKAFKRQFRKMARKALHGVSRPAVPSQLDSLRRALEIQKKQAEVAELLERS
jgi:hypothetical protein